MKKTSLKACLLIFLIIVLSNFVFADFLAEYNDKDITLCRCTTAIDHIRVTNTGNRPDFFQFSDNLDFVVLAETGLELLPGQSEDIPIFVSPLCPDEFIYSPPDSYTLKIKLRSLSDGKEQTIRKSIKLKHCQNTFLGLTASSPLNETLQPCTPITYDLFIQNTGNFIERYTVEMPQYAEYARISADNIFIRPNETANVKIDLTIPCNLYGDFSIPFVVKANKNQLEARVYHDLTIKKNYSFEVLFEDNLAVCELDEQIVPITLKNNIALPNNFSILLETKPYFVEFEDQLDVKLAGNEEKTFYVVIKPPRNSRADYTLPFRITSFLGAADYTYEMPLKIWPCYDVQLSVPYAYYDFCEGDYTVPVEVFSNTRAESIIELFLTAPSSVSFPDGETSLSLDMFAQERQTVNLEVEVPNDQTTDHEVSIFAVINGKPMINTTKSFMLHTFSDIECHTVNFDTQKMTVTFGTSERYIKIKNTGKQAATYSLSYVTQEWMTIDDEYTLFYLEPGWTKTIPVLFNIEDGTETGIYNLDIFVDSDKDMSFSNIVEVTLRDYNFCEKAWKFIKGTNCRLTFCILGIIFLFLLIILMLIPPVKGRSLRYLVLTVAVLFIILLLVLFYIIFFYKGVPQVYGELPLNQSGLYHEWPEDHTYQINLSYYFYDPDNDILNYEMIPLHKIRAEIKGDSLLLTPERDYFGEQELIIAAVDSYGAKTYGVPILLKVTNLPERTVFQKFDFYCWYANIVLLLLILYEIVLLVWKLARKNGKYEEAQRAREAQAKKKK